MKGLPGWIVLLPMLVHAATPEEDEAQIEALIQAELHPPVSVQATVAPPSNATSGAASTLAPAKTAAAAAASVAANQPPPEDLSNLRFDALKNHIGAKVHLILINGTERFARIESCDTREVSLSLASYEGAEFRFSVPREEIRRIELR